MTNTEPFKFTLRACQSCKICAGSSRVREAHGEYLDCECYTHNATDEQLDAIDAGAFWRLLPAVEWEEQRQGLHDWPPSE